MNTQAFQGLLNTLDGYGKKLENIILDLFCKLEEDAHCDLVVLS